MTPPPVIETRGLAKAFGPNRVLDGVDLRLARGESLVVIGGSGSGKSVLLQDLTASFAGVGAKTIVIDDGRSFEHKI